MRIAICWSHISGYMTACWRELARRPGVELFILAFRNEGSVIAFNDDLTHGLNCRMLDDGERVDTSLIKSSVAAFKPDVIVVPGWFHQPYRDLIADPQFAPARKLMGMDTPFKGTLRQKLARFKLASYLKQFDRVMVPGERAWQYARYLGVPETKIQRGMYGVDYRALSPIHEARAQCAGGWPRRFMFTGRYVEEKGIDVLVEAYRRYRAGVGDPWPLTCFGMGPLKSQLAAQPGIEDVGFCQPAELADQMARHGAFILSSRYDPWPLAIVEACAAGLPVICTEACGSAVELVRPYFSGLTVAAGDADSLARALRWTHDHHADLSEFGRRAQGFAAAYSAEAWADRWQETLRDIFGTLG